MEYNFSKEIDRQFEEYRKIFEEGRATLDDIEAFTIFMDQYGGHWNGEEWTFALEHTFVYVRPVWEEWNDDVFIVDFKFS